MTDLQRLELDDMQRSLDDCPITNAGLAHLKGLIKLQKLYLDGTKDEKWRRRKSNPRAQSRNAEVAQRLWNMLQDVGVSWEWTDDANRQPMALEHEELAEVMTGWPLLSPDLRQAILVIVRSSDVMAEASIAATE